MNNNIVEAEYNTDVENRPYGNVKIGDHIYMSAHICKVVEFTKSKTGKHGSAKVHIIGIDIFDKSKHQLVESSSAIAQVVTVMKHNYYLIGINDNFLSMLSESNKPVEHFKINDDEIGNLIKELYNTGKEVKITTIHANNKEMIIDAITI